MFNVQHDTPINLHILAEQGAILVEFFDERIAGHPGFRHDAKGWSKHFLPLQSASSSRWRERVRMFASQCCKGARLQGKPTPRASCPSWPCDDFWTSSSDALVWFQARSCACSDLCFVQIYFVNFCELWRHWFVVPKYPERWECIVFTREWSKPIIPVVDTSIAPTLQQLHLRHDMLSQSRSVRVSWMGQTRFSGVQADKNAAQFDSESVRSSLGTTMYSLEIGIHVERNKGKEEALLWSCCQNITKHQYPCFKTRTNGFSDRWR